MKMKDPNKVILSDENYRGSLIKSVKKLREQGESGKQLAETLLAQAKTEKEYQESKKVYDYPTELKKATEVLRQLKAKIKKADKWEKERIKVPSELTRFVKMLEKNDSIEQYSEEEQSIIVAVIEQYCVNNDGYIWDKAINLAKKHHNKLSQANMEKIIISLLNRSQYQRNSDMISNFAHGNYKQIRSFWAPPRGNVSQWQDFLLSAEKSVLPLVKETVNKTENQPCIVDVVCLLAKWRYDPNILPDRIIKMLQDASFLQKLFDKDKWEKWEVNAFELAEFSWNAGVKMPIDTLADLIVPSKEQNIKKNIYEPTAEYYDRGRFPSLKDNFDNNIKKLVSDKEKQSYFHKVTENGVVNSGIIHELRQIYTCKEIWAGISPEYKTPAFVVEHIEEYKELLSAEGVMDLLANDKGSEVFDSKIFTRMKTNNGGLNCWLSKYDDLQNIRLIFTKTNYPVQEYLSKNNWDTLLSYVVLRQLKRENEFIENIQYVWWGYHSSYEKIDEESQRALVNLLLDKGTPDQAWAMGEGRKRLNVMSDEQATKMLTSLATHFDTNNEKQKKIFNELLYYGESYPILTNNTLLIYLNYVIKNKVPGYPWKLAALPLSVYKKLIELKKLNTDKLPKVVDDPKVENVEQIIAAYKQAV